MNTEELMESLKAIVKPYIKSEEGFKNMTEDSDFLKDLKINSASGQKAVKPPVSHGVRMAVKFMSG